MPRTFAFFFDMSCYFICMFVCSCALLSTLSAINAKISSSGRNFVLYFRALLIKDRDRNAQPNN